MNILEVTEKFCEEMNKTNSTLDKKEVLKKYPEMKEMLEWVYNPFKQFYITSKVLKKHDPYGKNHTKAYNDIFDLLHDLNKRKITGHEAISNVNAFIVHNEPMGLAVIENIIDKDLKCRIGDKIINDVYPNLIPTFSVSLCNKFQDRKDKIIIDDGTWHASHKLDGCRCIAIIDKEGDIKFFSRQGNEFETLDVLRKEIEKLNLKNIVLDGEVCICDSDGNENFSDIMKLIKRKDFDIPNPKYLVFDTIDYDDFFRTESDMLFIDRQKRLNELCKSYKGNNIEVLKQTKILSEDHFAELVKEAKDKNWEGLILRRNVGYEGKRSNNLLKVKEMSDAEYAITGYETGPFRVIENGVEVTIETLSAIKIMHKGNEVSVGSGFTVDERKQYYKDLESLIGRTITVQFFEETINKEGKYSLRFPIKKFIYDGKRGV